MAESAIHINVPLTNISVQYRNTDYIAEDVVAVVPVAKDSNSYWIHPSDFLVPETRRANKSEANMLSWGASTASYALVDHALKDLVSDKDRRNADAPLQMDVETTEYLTDKIMLRKEIEASAILFTTTTFGNNTTYTTTATQSWKTSTVYPTRDIQSATSVIRKASAMRPNEMLMGQQAFDTACENANIINRIQYVERAIVTESILAALFRVGNVRVGTTIYDTSKEGLSVSTADIWGDNVLLHYKPQRPGLRVPASVYCFRNGTRTVRKWRDEGKKGDMIEVGESYSFEPVATATAYLIKSVSL